ncbi:tonsoku-like protein [Artemia franciscana]
MARATFTLGRTYHQWANVESNLPKLEVNRLLGLAEQYFKQSMEITEICRRRGGKDVEIDSMTGRAVMNIGLVCETKNDIESAVENFKKALQIFLRYENSESKEIQEDLWRCFRNLAGTFEKLHQYEEALNFIKKAATSSEKLNNIDDLIDDYLFACRCHFRCGEFRIPKKLLLKSRLLAKELGLIEKITEIENTLKKVIKIRSLQSFIEENDDPLLLPKKYEDLGDALVSPEITAYRKGVEAYRECLKIHLDSGIEPTNPLLGPIYVSIADTYKDLGELEKVVEFYKKEIHCYLDDEKETARSYLAIADVEAELGKDVEHVCKSYMTAYNKAVVAERFKLAKHILYCRTEYVRNSAPDKIAEVENDYRQFCQAYDFNENEIEDPDTDSRHSQSQISEPPSSDIDFSDLSSEEGEETKPEDVEENAYHSRGRGLRTRRTYLSTMSKKDERGETPLHKAAREGNIKKVKTLVMAGADINAYDNGGWTPLHEAALGGNIEVVDYLLKHGADMSKTGVEVFKYVTEGMSPLHDAALEGHIDVMKLMIKKGANILAKTEKGETPLDYFRNCRLRKEESDDFDNYTRQEMMDFEEELLKDMIKGGYKALSRSLCRADVSAVVAEGEDYEVKTVPDDVIEYDDSDQEENCECSEGGPCAQHRHVPNLSQKMACEEYASAIKQVRSSAMMNESAKRTRVYPSPVKDITRLSPINERKRSTSFDRESARPVKRVFEERELTSSQLRKGFLPDVIPLSAESEFSFAPKRPIQPKINRVLERAASTSFKHSTQRNSDSSLGRSNLQGESRQRHQIGGSSSSRFVDAFREDRVSSPKKTPDLPRPVAVLNVIVQIEGKKLLIPIMDASATIGWLAEESSKRFSCSDPAQRRPVISLEKGGGISLSEEDLVTIVVKDGEFLTGIPLRWCSVQPSQKYKDFCASQKSFTYSSIKKAMEELEQTNILRIKGSSLKPNILLPAVKAIELYSTVAEIDFSGHQLGDENFQVLVSAFQNMPNLRRLNFQSSGLTVFGLKFFATQLQQSLSLSAVPLLQNLEYLNLSSNHFGDIFGDILASILGHLDELDTLAVENCHLTAKLFEKAANLESAIPRSNVKRWLIGYNKWGKAGLEKWTKILKGKHLQALSLSGLCTDPASAESCKEEAVCGSLLTIFSGMAQVPLEELDLSECGIHSPQGISSISRLLVRAKYLKILRLEKNQDLSYTDISVLLKGICQWKLPVEQLSLSGCENLFPFMLFSEAPDGRNPLSSIMDEGLRAMFELLEKLYRVESFVRFEFTLHPKVPESWAGFIKGMWVAAKGNQGRVTQGERSRVIMTCLKP